MVCDDLNEFELVVAYEPVTDSMVDKRALCVAFVKSFDAVYVSNDEVKAYEPVTDSMVDKRVLCVAFIKSLDAVYALNDEVKAYEPVTDSILDNRAFCAVSFDELTTNDAVLAKDELNTDIDDVIVVVTIFVLAAEPVIVGEYIFIVYL